VGYQPTITLNLSIQAQPRQGVMMSTKQAKRTQRPSSRDVLTETELQQIIAAAKNNPGTADIPHIVTIVSHTGIRLGELAELRWSDVDLDKAQLVITSMTSGTRMVPLDAESCKALETLHTLRPESKLLVGGSSIGVRSRVSHQLRILTAQLGMRNVTFHALRHTFFTRLVFAGVPANVIMAIGGWKSSSLKSLAKFCTISDDAVRRGYEAAMKNAV
jgi:integrase